MYCTKQNVVLANLQKKENVMKNKDSTYYGIIFFISIMFGLVAYGIYDMVGWLNTFGYFWDTTLVAPRAYGLVVLFWISTICSVAFASFGIADYWGEK